MSEPTTVPPARPDYQAACAYLKRAHGVHEFADSVELLRLADTHFPESPNVFGDRWASKVGSYRVDRERNTLGEWFCSHGEGVTKALLLDDDHSFTPDQVYQLLALCGPERPVVSGLYFAVHSHDRNHPFVRPLLFNHARMKSGEVDLENYRTDYSFPRDTLVPVDHIGLGFCAIWLPLLKAWAKDHGSTWFDFGYRPSGKHTLEDEAFCRRVRHEMQQPIFVHTGLCVKHWKPWGIDLEFFENQTAGYQKRQGLLAESAEAAALPTEGVMTV